VSNDLEGAEGGDIRGGKNVSEGGGVEGGLRGCGEGGGDEGGLRGCGEGGGGGGGSGETYSSSSAMATEPWPTVRIVTKRCTTPPHSNTYGAGSVLASNVASPHRAASVDVSPKLSPAHTSTEPNREL
jgi:hypothetical protein